MSIYAQALDILQTADPQGKRLKTRELAKAWGDGARLGTAPPSLPLRPARPQNPVLVPPGDVPRRRIGSPAGRAALLHAVAHIEFNAIDLALDMLCRFGQNEALSPGQRQTFADDWISVADDEARHFGLINDRLQTMDYAYGDFPAHNGLWEAAQSTFGDIAARLAIAPMVLEARGLDVTPAMIEKFKRAKDMESADILTIIYEDEIGHVAKGAKWFHFIARERGNTPENYFKALIKTHFKGQLKPPFNETARTLAGIPKAYYASTL